MHFKSVLFSLILSLLGTFSIAQQNIDSSYTYTYKSHHWGMIDSETNIRITNFIAPAAAITYGFIALKNHTLDQLNLSTRAELREDHPGFKTTVDNYLQYSPAAAVFALQLAGVKGRNKPLKEVTIYATSMAIAGAVVLPIKHWAHEIRPDSSNYESFPSGHTTTAFASAEFLRIEYGRTSPWIAVAGYAAATATAALRLYNNKHWFSDVVAGAGFGIAATDIAYWLNDKVFWKNKKNTSLSFFPTYQNGSFGAGLVKVF